MPARLLLSMKSIASNSRIPRQTGTAVRTASWCGRWMPCMRSIAKTPRISVASPATCVTSGGKPIRKMPRKAKKPKKSTSQGVRVPKVLTGATNRGQRKYQEDRHLMISAEEGLILAVMDGHGGAECSEKLEQNFCMVWDAVYSSDKTPE